MYRNDSSLNYYESPSFDDDLGVVMYTYEDWKIGESDFTKVSKFTIIIFIGVSKVALMDT